VELHLVNGTQQNASISMALLIIYRTWFRRPSFGALTCYKPTSPLLLQYWHWPITPPCLNWITTCTPLVF
jgi:hypothetical protein